MTPNKPNVSFHDIGMLVNQLALQRNHQLPQGWFLVYAYPLEGPEGEQAVGIGALSYGPPMFQALEDAAVQLSANAMQLSLRMTPSGPFGARHVVGESLRTELGINGSGGES